VEFKVFGLSENDIKTLKAIDLPKNIELFGYIPQEELIAYYQRAKVYCQLSFIESFGMALAEAMSSECIPVVTDRGALPEVAENTGFYVSYGDPETAAKAIKEALKSNKGKEARERIKKMFPIEKREKELIKMIEEITK
jgi:glycosyltransferase involved in cell wall biosynthesis